MNPGRIISPWTKMRSSPKTIELFLPRYGRIGCSRELGHIFVIFGIVMTRERESARREDGGGTGRRRRR